MKYNININQKAIIDNKFNIDIIDAAIFNLLKDFAHSNNCNKSIINGETFYQWGSTGKMYKKREDAEKQGYAIESQGYKPKSKTRKRVRNGL